MLLLDVNVVVAAYREDHPHHARTRSWFDEVLHGDEQFTVPLGVWASFLRLVTSTRVFAEPTPLADAFAFVDAVVAQPHHLPVAPGPRHLELLRRVCEDAEATGDLVPDAALAAVALEHGAQVVTLDRDFGRFALVRSRRPGRA